MWGDCHLWPVLIETGTLLCHWLPNWKMNESITYLQCSQELFSKKNKWKNARIVKEYKIFNVWPNTKNSELKVYLQLSVKLSARVCEIWPIVPSDNVKSSLKLSLKVPHNPTNIHCYQNKRFIRNVTTTLCLWTLHIPWDVTDISLTVAQLPYYQDTQVS